MEKEVETKGELTTAEEAEQLHNMLDLGKQAIAFFSEQGDAQNRLAREQLQLAEKRLEFEKSAFSYKAFILVGLLVGIFSIAAGLIFALREVESGILILSHVGTLFAGALAGWGWERKKSD